jgi:hypothetical protein
MHTVSFIRGWSWIAAEQRLVEKETVITQVEFSGMPEHQKAYAASFGTATWRILFVANGVQRWLSETFGSTDEAQRFLESRLSAA